MGVYIILYDLFYINKKKIIFSYIMYYMHNDISLNNGLIVQTITK